MAQLAIKGHAKRGKEVIEILEMLGGKIRYDRLAGNGLFSWYYINGNGYIDYKHYSLFDATTVFTIEEFLEKFPYKVGDKVQSKGATSCGTVYVIEHMKWANNHIEYEIRPLYDYYHTGLGTLCVEDLQPYKEETMEPIIKMNPLEMSGTQCIIPIPKGYEFAGVDDDEQQVVFTKIQPEYPKTHLECCDVLGRTVPINDDVEGYKWELIMNLQRLIVSRDAYWKIAGEQMGLDKPWEPDWTNLDQLKYCIWVDVGEFVTMTNVRGQHILAFPTAEMRDAFYENFKDLIIECKELL